MKSRRKVRPGNRPHTAEESARFAAIQECVPCVLNVRRGDYDFCGVAVERNHMKRGGLRISHLATWGGCRWHHQAVLPDGFTTTLATARFGPSLAKGSRPFHAHYGTDAELLELQNALLAGP